MSHTMKTTEASALPPVAITMIGTGSGGADPIVTGMTATTPGKNQPNLLVTVISPLVAIGVRFAHMYLTTLVGLITGGLTTEIIPATDFFDLLWKCAALSVAGAFLGLIKDGIAIFSVLGKKYPLAIGEV